MADKMSFSIPRIPLSSSQTAIPAIGFGTAMLPLDASTHQTVKESVLHAIKLGYRHFDTAAIYQSEQPLGEAIEEALSLGLINSRDELFITSKLWCGYAHYHLVLPALQMTLKNLKLEFIDLYLIHFPAGLKPETKLPFKKEDIIPMDFESVWKAMEECQKLGLTKSIGVSNFSCKKIGALLATATIPPAVNQVDMNPLWHQKKLRQYCGDKGIHVTAHSPLGAKGTPWGQSWVMDCEELKDIADAKGKSVAQVCMRWLYEQGVSVVVKSSNKERMKENLDIFGWELSLQDLEKISQLPQRKGFLGEAFISDDGPFKTLEDIWDDDI
ncbi:hypothetical protein L6164_026573 [Bauhinia variegata]|uniref:Uncharacterized protein n=1 Tax=Bauhinia variegata TaxID=167791 RepID=A0ACB9LS29_BAUVA|nr:hypothetical protein L6164_026573 [Bauhinia variegata]